MTPEIRLLIGLALEPLNYTVTDMLSESPSVFTGSRKFKIVPQGSDSDSESSGSTPLIIGLRSELATVLGLRSELATVLGLMEVSRGYSCDYCKLILQDPTFRVLVPLKLAMYYFKLTEGRIVDDKQFELAFEVCMLHTDL